MPSLYRFCPKCGGSLEERKLHPEDIDLVPVCTACGFEFFQVSSPGVGAMIVRDAKLLLTRRAIDPRMGLWDLPGGFLRKGESVEDGLQREIQEELAVTIRVTDFLCSRINHYMLRGYEPDGITALDLFFLSELVVGEPCAASEISEIRWFAPDEIPPDDQFAFPTNAYACARWRELFPV